MGRQRGLCLLASSITVGLLLIYKLTSGGSEVVDSTHEFDPYRPKSQGFARKVVKTNPPLPRPTGRKMGRLTKAPVPDSPSPTEEEVLPEETYPSKGSAEGEGGESVPFIAPNTEAPLPPIDCSTFASISINKLNGATPFEMRVDPAGDLIINHIRSYGYWESDRSTSILLALANVAAETKRRPIFLDIGANIGYFGSLAAAHNCRVFMFEPLMHNYNMIRCTMQEVAGLAENIRLFTAGAAGSNTSCGIYSDAHNPNDGHVICDMNKVLKADPTFLSRYSLRETIRTLRIDSLGIEAPDVVKIDVEGHEMAAFEGIVSMMDKYPHKFKVILTEFGPWMIHRKGYDPVKYLEIFDSRGYEIYDGSNVFAWSAEFVRNAITKESIFDLTMYKKGFDRPLHNLAEAAEILFSYKDEVKEPEVAKSIQLAATVNPTTNCDDFRELPVVLPDALRFKMKVDTSGDWIINAIQSKGNWEPDRSNAILMALGNVARVANRRPVFMDIGANIGYFTALVAAHYVKVYSFEPLKKNYDMIRCTIQNDRLMAENILLYTAGAAGANTSCGIYSDAQNPNDGHVICDTSKVLAADPSFMSRYYLRETINTLRIDSLGIEAPDVVKIDVEGHEMAAFEGLVSMMDKNPDRFRVILTEFGPWMMHRKGYDPYKYLQIFVTRGYDIFDGQKPFAMDEATVKMAIAREYIYDLTMYKRGFQKIMKDLPDAVSTLQEVRSKK